MKKTKAFYMVVVLAVSGLLLSTVSAQTIPEEARRHMARGQAAVEMAKTPEDYELAVKEFQKAQAMAPEWPDVYYNLGLIQEKSGKYRDAASSLRKYLQLAPESPNAAKIQEQIYKLEYKAEQVITDEDVLNIFVSLTDSSQWQLKGITNANILPRDWVKSFSRNFKPGNQDRLFFEFYSGSCCPTLHGFCPGDALPIGKSIEFQTFYCACKDGGCLSSFLYRLEVVSRNKVKMTVRVRSAKEFGGGTEDASFEFVRR